MAFWKRARGADAMEYATVLVGNVIRVRRWSDFADKIDPAALDAVTGRVAGLGQHEVAGTISRPGGGFLWEPHPVFARVGVPTIRATAEELGMVIQPDPSTPADKRDYTIFLRAADKDDIDIDTELDFTLKRLDLG